MATLLYWKKRGRGEQCRIWAHICGFEYKNEFITGKELAAEREAGKAKAFGSVPVLSDGEVELGQAVAICEYMANKTGKNPSNSGEAAKVLSLALGAEDLRINYFKYFGLKNDEDKSNWLKTTLTRWLTSYEKILHKNQDGKSWLVGSSLTYADACFFEVIDAIIVWIPGSPDILKHYPLVQGYYERMKTELADYLASEKHFKS